MGKVCDKYCNNCIYYHGWYESNKNCNYILMEDKMRGCDPGKGCIRKIKCKGKRERREIKWID